MLYEDVANADTADRMVTTLDLANITGGAIDSTWTAADYTTVDAQLHTLANVWAAECANHVAFVGAKYYVRAFNDMGNPKPFVIGGPPEHMFTTQTNGLGGAPQAPQVSVTTTEKTPFPHHWGRNYWPTPSATLCSPSGRISVVNVDAIATGISNVYNGLMAAEFFPVVPVTQVQKQPWRGLLTVTSVQVDDVFDVQRRRRSHAAQYKKVLPVGA